MVSTEPRCLSTRLLSQGCALTAALGGRDRQRAQPKEGGQCGASNCLGPAHGPPAVMSSGWPPLALTPTRPALQPHCPGFCSVLHSQPGAPLAGRWLLPWQLSGCKGGGCQSNCPGAWRRNTRWCDLRHKTVTCRPAPLQTRVDGSLPSWEGLVFSAVGGWALWELGSGRVWTLYPHWVPPQDRSSWPVEPWGCPRSAAGFSTVSSSPPGTGFPRESQFHSCTKRSSAWPFKDREQIACPIPSFLRSCCTCSVDFLGTPCPRVALIGPSVPQAGLTTLQGSSK